MAAGDDYTSAKMTLDELFDASNAEGWCDVCKGWEDKKIYNLLDS